MPQDYNAPLHAQLHQAAGAPDQQLLSDIEHGFPMAGYMPDSQLFPHLDWEGVPSKQELQAALDTGISQAHRTIDALLNRKWVEPHNEELRRQSDAEVKTGKLAGPWEIYKDGQGNMVSTVPFNEWLPTLRFPRVQQGEHTSYKVRPIDDCTASGLNPAAAVCEKMHMSGLQTLLALGALTTSLFEGWGGDSEPLLQKADHEQAFRQWTRLINRGQALIWSTRM